MNDIETFLEAEKRELRELVKEYSNKDYLCSEENGTEASVISALIDIENWLSAHDQRLLAKVREIVANYTVDMCENSQEFKQYLLSLLPLQENE